MMAGKNDDEIGYRHPPRWTRFRKGQSGNPKGRPRKKAPAATSAEMAEPETASEAILRAELDRMIAVTEAGKPARLKVEKILRRKQIAEGLKGNVPALRDLHRDAERLRVRDAQRAEANAIAAREKEIEDAKADERFFVYLIEIKQAQAEAWEKALAEGRKEPDFPWPHPDDIMLDETRRKYRLRGPMDDRDVLSYRRMQAQRDYYFSLCAQALRARHKSQRRWSEVWAFVWMYIDQLLPLRWQVGHDYELLLMLHLEMPLHDLKAIVIDRDRRARELEALTVTPEEKKASYKVANQVMAPLLKKQGYRSLVQFERAYEETGGDPPWPLLSSGKT